MTPAEELRAAAALLRQRAENASPGPWSAGSTDEDGEWHPHYGSYGWYVTGPEGSPEFEDNARGLADAEWVATVHPGVGLLLADLLEHFTYTLPRELHAARELARAILSAGRQGADAETDAPPSTSGSVTS